MLKRAALTPTAKVTAVTMRGVAKARDSNMPAVLPNAPTNSQTYARTGSYPKANISRAPATNPITTATADSVTGRSVAVSRLLTQPHLIAKSTKLVMMAGFALLVFLWFKKRGKGGPLT
jgi:hypothetical protein